MIRPSATRPLFKVDKIMGSLPLAPPTTVPTGCIPTAITTVGQTRYMPLFGVIRTCVDPVNHLAYTLGVNGSSALQRTVVSVWDVSDPTDQQLITTQLVFPATCTGMVLIGDVLIGHASTATTLYAVDMSDPFDPQLLDTEVDATNFVAAQFFEAHSDDHIYLGFTNKLVIVNATDPSNLSVAQTITSSPAFSQIRNICFDANYAYVTCGGTTNLSPERMLNVVDITPPASASVVGSVDSILGNGPTAPHPCAKVGDRVYSGMSFGYWNTVDVTTPTAPVDEGWGNETAPGGSAFDVDERYVVPHPTAGLLSWGDNDSIASEVRTWDVSTGLTLADPDEVDQLTTTTGSHGQLDGDTLFMVHSVQTNPRLHSIDVTPANDITTLQELTDVSGFAPSCALIEDDLMYVACGGVNTITRHLAIYDISDPEASPMPLVGTAFISTSTANVEAIVKHGDHILILAVADGLVTVDVSDPENPVEVNVETDATNLESNRPRDMFLVADTLFVLGGDSTGSGSASGYLAAWNVTDPVNPVPISRITSSNFQAAAFTKVAIVVRGDYAFTIANTHFTTINVADPSAMIILDDTTDASLTSMVDLVVNATHAFVITTAEDLVSIGVTDPSAISGVAQVITLAPATVLTTGNIFLEADDDPAVYIGANDRAVAVNISNPASMELLLSTVMDSTAGTATNGQVYKTGEMLFHMSNSGNRVISAEITCE